MGIRDYVIVQRSEKLKVTLGDLTDWNNFVFGFAIFDNQSKLRAYRNLKSMPGITLLNFHLRTYFVLIWTEACIRFSER